MFNVAQSGATSVERATRSISIADLAGGTCLDGFTFVYGRAGLQLRTGGEKEELCLGWGEGNE